ncbi:hypothetical protein [Ornithinibacillus halotolerans]|uniref:Uncharacterized protein n=1 Tax=Ornithinibacillus halotolerans TaxID=1274357 RepID=A0A916W4V0_9BACI|nr:hypothetical protein [Ornithinibacillus halotolerans]GGA66397.1 hypothetical protein GCM10008025_07790 [Ornithinibacillus halotolerans]
MLKKVITAIVSTLIFGAVMGLVNYLTSPISDFNNFWLPAVYFALYSAPVYLIGGIPISYLIERLLKKLNFNSDIARHYTKYGLFILVGIIVGIFYVLILKISGNQSNQELLVYLVGGVLASLIFYYVSLVFNREKVN